MKRQKWWSLTWLLAAFAIVGCTDIPKLPEPEVVAPVHIDSLPDYNPICVGLSPDGWVLACGMEHNPEKLQNVKDGRVVLYDVRTGKEVQRLLGPEGDWPLAMRFSPDGKRLAVAGSGKAMTIWDVATGKNRGDLEGTLGGGTSREWTPDGAMLVGDTLKLDHGNLIYDSKYHLWSGEDGKDLRSLDLGGGPWGRGDLLAIAVDSSTMAVEHWRIERVHPDAKDDHFNRWQSAVDLWDLRTGRRLGAVAGFSAPVEAYYQPPRRGPEVGAEDGQFKAHALPGDRYLLLPTYDRYPALAMKPDGQPIVLSDALTGKEVGRLSSFEHGNINSPVMASDGSAVAEAAQLKEGRWERGAQFWDLHDLADAARKAGPHRAAEQLAPLWDTLAGTDATKALPAMRLLALNPERAVPLLREHLRPMDDHRLPQWIADLNSDDFEKREAASRGLATLGEMARPALEKALASDPGPEVRRRAEALLEKLKGAVAPEELRGVRAVDVLEQIGTDAARSVLKDLAAGSPGALTTQAAKDALDRLEKVPKP